MAYHWRSHSFGMGKLITNQPSQRNIFLFYSSTWCSAVGNSDVWLCSRFVLWRHCELALLTFNWESSSQRLLENDPAIRCLRICCICLWHHMYPHVFFWHLDQWYTCSHYVYLRSFFPRARVATSYATIQGNLTHWRPLLWWPDQPCCPRSNVAAWCSPPELVALRAPAPGRQQFQLGWMANKEAWEMSVFFSCSAQILVRNRDISPQLMVFIKQI